jgi:hypothetical protein
MGISFPAARGRHLSGSASPTAIGDDGFGQQQHSGPY